MRPYLTLHTPRLAKSYYDKGLWREDTFYGLLAAHARRHPDRMALRDGQDWLDWRSLKARVDAMADSLVNNKILAGDRVSLWTSNRIGAVITFLACAREGVACNPSLHRSHTCAEVIGLLKELQAKAIVTEAGYGADRAHRDFDAMLARLPFLNKAYSVDRMPQHILEQDRAIHDDPDSVAYLAFTSGTTGQPKCVMHSANTLLANARDLVRDWALDHQSIILSLSPLSHHIAWVGVAQWLLCGGQFVTNDPRDGKTSLDWMIETGATYVMGVPTHAMDILAEQRLRNIARLGEVRAFYTAGAPIPELLGKAFFEQGIRPQNVYGMTECSSHHYTHPSDNREISTLTCGRGGAAYEVKIWDPANRDRELPIGMSGEIGGKGAAMMLGYFGAQSATETCFNAQGYLMSGDLGALDQAGNLRILGRIKDVIIRGGYNIYPARIESLAMTHRRIERAAVFGMSDERLGEKAVIAITGRVSGQELLAHLLRGGLSKFDLPEWFLDLSDMPLTASGKIRKPALIQMVQQGQITPQPLRLSDQPA